VARAPRRGRETLKAGLFALAGIVAAIIIVGIVASKNTVENERRMVGVFETRIALQHVFVDVIDQETAIRGYAATHDERFLMPYFKARGQIDADFADLEAGGRTELPSQIAEIKRLYVLWRETVGAPLVERPDRPDRTALELRGKDLVDRIREQGNEARAKLDALLAERIRISARIRAIETGSVILLVILFGAAGLTFGRERVRAEVRLKEALAERNAALERSNQSLEEFAYVASHDLQEPLRAITGFTKLLQSRYAARLDGEALQFMGFVVDGAERMSLLIDDVLRYSRVTTSGAELAAVDLNVVVRRAAQNLQAALAASSAQIVFDGLPDVLGDETQLVQLMQNLIGNAVKYNRSTPPRIEISAVQNEDGEWVVSVRDNGIGIDPKYQERIFRIFTRLHTREEFGGTGIGLALCRRIIERHGGRIWVASVEGKGATFSFTLRPVNAKGLA
jgi:signal transduction histidine kinase